MLLNLDLPDDHGLETKRFAPSRTPERPCYSEVSVKVTLLTLASPFLLLSSLCTAQSDWFSIAVLPDTQNEAQFAPDMMLKQTQWIAANRTKLRIQAVLGLGDIVNDGASNTQQSHADSAVRVLDDAAIPYLLAIGNHDYDGANTGAAKRSATGFNKWWGPARYANKTYYRGQYPLGSNENFYGVLTIYGKQFLVMVLEYIPRTESLDWATWIIQNNPDKDVIVVTHSFLFNDGTRVDRCDTNDLNRDNDGDETWARLRDYPNVIMVLSGHITTGQAAHRADLGTNGNLVNQVYSDYQTENNGNGWLRIMTINPDSNSIHVQTYSPVLGQFSSLTKNDFYLNYRRPAHASTGTGGVAGRIRDAGNCLPISSVTLSSSGTPMASSGSYGWYTYSVAAPGNYQVSASKAGWASATSSIKVDVGYKTSLNFYLWPPLCALDPASPSVTICLPGNGGVVPSPVRIFAAAKGTAPISLMSVFIDGVYRAQMSGDRLYLYVKGVPTGTHHITVNARDSAGLSFNKSVDVTVQ